MGKLFMLVKNELIKLLKRKSIPVMFLVTVVIALGVALLYNFSRPAEGPADGEYQISEWKKEIEDLERFFAPDHYLDGVYADNSLRGKQYRNRSEMLQYLVEKGYSPYDWRYSSGLIEAIFDNKFQMDLNYDCDRQLAGLLQGAGRGPGGFSSPDPSHGRERGKRGRLV